MDGLSQQIASGLPVHWRRISADNTLPKNISILYAATDEIRKLVFVLVTGPMRSAIPLFDVNTTLRRSGFETVWLFSSAGIPSTRHMLCAALERNEGKSAVSILNTSRSGLIRHGAVSISELACAAADQRLKTIGFIAGQFVDVTFTADERMCVECGAIVHELQQATFYPLGEPRSPGLALSKGKLGRSVSKLIADAIAIHPDPNSSICNQCCCSSPFSRSRSSIITKSIGGIQLSSVAVYELIRFQKTAWYIC